MATRSTTRKTTASKSQTQAAVEAVAVQKDECVVTPAPEAHEAYIAKPVIDPHATVIVRNGFHGKLVYKSRRTGERYVWEQFGDEQEIEVQELRNAKGSDKAYFTQNWFLFDDPEIIDYLGVSTYYKNALRYEDFDELFDMDAAAIEARLNTLPSGQKKSVAYRAAQLVASHSIDSLSKIAMLERVLGITLIER